VPKRLTYHPSADTVRGWTPDGRRIMFTSTRASYYHFADQLFTVPAGGGFAVQVPLPIVEDASYSADASYLAYVPHPQMAICVETVSRRPDDADLDRERFGFADSDDPARELQRL
jgi:WD40-like Beta Propeller Repeat